MAAKFIRDKFIKYQLHPIDHSFFQPFTISQNLFPKEPHLTISNRKLTVGADFIPSPGCPSISGRFRIRRMDSASLDSAINGQLLIHRNEAWVVASRFKKWILKLETFKKNRPLLVVWAESKLTHSLSETQTQNADICVKTSLLQDIDSVLEIKIQARSSPKIQTQNVVGMIKGTQYPDSFLVLCAHYDHLGSLGKKVYFPGASDNASGSAMLLEMADHFSKKPLRYSLLFIAFTGEEAGLLGSQYFVNHPFVPLSNIKFVMNMDLMGFGEKGATVVNATLHPSEFKRLSQINETYHFLPELKSRGKAANSDHYPFSEAGVPAFFIYTMGGPGYYHDVDDRPETVTFSRFGETFKLITTFMEGF